MELYDLAILGGGPAGYLAAERAAASGLKTALFEESNPGGVCLNEGCIPTKAMLNASKYYYAAQKFSHYGVHSDGAGISIAHGAVLERKEKVVRTLVSGVKAKLKAAGAAVFYGHAAIAGKAQQGHGGGNTGGNNSGGGSSGGNYVIAVQTGQNAGLEVLAARVLIATGSAPIIPPIDGVREQLESGLVITSREALSLEAPPKELVIVGGGVIGLELADYYNAAGSNVTIVELLDRIAAPMDLEISNILMANLKKKGIAFKTGRRLASASPDGSIAIMPNETLHADKVLLCVGRKPRTADIGLEALGVCVERGAVICDEHMRTNVPNIYAAGDVNGKSMLAHTAYREAECAVGHMLGKPSRMKYGAIPSVIYTYPEAAGVGETSESAAAKGLDVRTVKLPLRYSGRYVAEEDNGDGMCKLLIDPRNRKVAGAHVIGSYASEIILSAAFMIESNWPVEALRELVFPHPTVGEALRDALFEA